MLTKSYGQYIKDLLDRQKGIKVFEKNYLRCLKLEIQLMQKNIYVQTAFAEKIKSHHKQKWDSLRKYI